MIHEYKLWKAWQYLAQRLAYSPACFAARQDSLERLATKPAVMEKAA